MIQNLVQNFFFSHFVCVCVCVCGGGGGGVKSYGDKLIRSLKLFPLHVMLDLSFARFVAPRAN